MAPCSELAPNLYINYIKEMITTLANLKQGCHQMTTKLDGQKTIETYRVIAHMIIKNISLKTDKVENG